MSQNSTDGLTPKQEQAIVALLNEPTVTRAAKSLGVNDRTLYRWMDEPAFSRAYRKARREAFGQAIALTQRYAPAAVHTLATIMSDEKAPHTARVNAATAILRFTRESIELDDLAARVEALEREADDEQPRPWRAA
jgi:hypothetical protein